jgi:hypothetical protein
MGDQVLTVVRELLIVVGNGNQLVMVEHFREV